MPRNNDRKLDSKNRLVFSLGSNVGNRSDFLNQGICKLDKIFNENLFFLQSKVFETEPWGMENQPGFLNQIIIVESGNWAPREVLEKCLEIEKELGRVRMEKWGPRTLDIDILFFDNKIVNELDLVIPHPEIQNRRFILAPLASIDPQFIHPILNKSILQLLEECTDPLSVKIYSLENIVNHKN